MRNVESHILEDKMDEAVTYYINSHQQPESVHIDANSLALNVQDDGGGRVLTVMHPQNFPSQMCRQVSVGEQVGEGPWVEELLDPEGRLAALVAHLTQHSRASHHQTHSAQHKVPSVRSDVDPSVTLDTPMRLFNGPHLDPQSDTIVVEVPALPTLPPLQDMKRCPDTDWFNKNKNNLKDDSGILEQDPVLDIGTSPANKQSKKSLPHKKRISRKLKRSNESSTPQQDIVVINCSEPPQGILPDSFAHEMRAMFICQLCGEFYGEEQLKFYQHLKQHYEPNATIIIENPVPDLGIDKMTNTCIVDNVPTLPDSIVELSLEGSVPKTMYQSIDKHILYTASDKTLNYTSNKLQYSVASMDKEVPDVEKNDLYDSLDKLEYFCTKCNKSFKKQKQCEAHIKEAHSNAKLEDMGEFSEPEDLMEGIHVAVEEGAEPYEQALLPHLTVENGHVHQEHVRHWYMRNGTGGGAASPLCACGGAGYCAACAPVAPHDSPHVSHASHVSPHVSHASHVSQASHVSHASQVSHAPALTSVAIQATGQVTLAPSPSVVQRPPDKDEALQRMFETENRPESFPDRTSEIQRAATDRAAEHTPDGHAPTAGHVSAEHVSAGHVSAEHVSAGHVSAEHVSAGHVSAEHVSAGHVSAEHVSAGHVSAEHVSAGHVSAEHVSAGHASTEHVSAGHASTEHVSGGHAAPAAGARDKKRSGKTFECAQCGRVFQHRNSLSYHTLMHGEKQQTCRECGKSFYTVHALKIHKRVHSDDRPCKCDECGREFRQWSDLKYHKASLHSDKKHFKCDFCGKEFARRYSLSVHRRIHTGEKNYKCEYCNKSFRASSYRLIHMRTHTGNKPYKCTQCEKCFRVSYDLQRHMHIHEKVRVKAEEQKKAKETNEKNSTNTKTSEEKLEPKSPKSDQKKSETRLPILKSLLDKKPARQSKKSLKKPPNVTVQNRTDEQFDEEIFDTRQDPYKFKEVYTIPKEYSDIVQRLERSDEKELATLRSIKTPQICETEERSYSRENTDGKMQVFTQIEKAKEYNGPIVTNVVSLSDIRNLEREPLREPRAEIQGEGLENGFLERLSAFYNIPAV
ncbi:unnamed protein product [Euphydryas editha]|uniref:C2H2-type domain-containing protein n=1 Tax=Euphydryas editha TaxID=104508 RepID=A0AAU9TZP7_EUPED|nr:unnamed protein product [Euphydryas editha]